MVIASANSFVTKTKLTENIVPIDCGGCNHGLMFFKFQHNTTL